MTMQNTPDPSAAIFSLAGKGIALIGAGSGIGEASARACAAQGAAVACLDLDLAAAERVAAAIRALGGTATAGSLDIRDGDDTERALTEAAEALGGLHGIVCTPGVNVRKPLLDYTADEFQKVVDVNLKGSFNVLRGGARVLLRQRTGAGGVGGAGASGAAGHHSGGGSIVLFASIRAHAVEPGQSVYAATKAGVIQLARTGAAELGGSGIRVNVVAPGVVETPLTAPIKAHADWYNAYATKSALGRWGQPHELAGPTAFLLSDASAFMTGAVLYVDGGWTAVDGRFTPPGMTLPGSEFAEGAR
jgi:NAD(P)-dependent dehydrogenase (short-subunit alcohol dehydrogenase family)